MFKSLLGSAAAAALVLGSAPAAQASDADVIREAKDRADIEVMVWKYVQALDNRDENAYPTFFTEDGTLCCEHNHVFKGRAELKQLMLDDQKANAELKAQGKTVPKIWHPIFNFHIEFRDKDHAHIDSYWFTVRAMSPPNGAPEIALVGRDEDEVVRVNGQWLFKSRNVFP